MTALKTYLPTLSSRIGRSPDQLDQWLRAMVAGKLLAMRPGRGPGSGVELSGKSVATMLLAVLASDLRSEAVQRAKVLAKLKPHARGGACPITGASNLRDAIAFALENETFAAGETAPFAELRVQRGDNLAKMGWRQPNGSIQWLVFASEEGSPTRITIEAVLHGYEIGKIAGDLRDLGRDP